MERETQTIPTEEKSPVSSGQVRNANSRTIFGNDKLTCQFLNNYSNIPIFTDVKPEDIEDVTERYQAFLGIEFESDTVKKVRVTIDGQPQEVFVLPLIEHKSYVDYDVSMQIFRYMAVIWYDYAKKQNALHKDISHTKDFRYPLIIPIVYYEGAHRWSAGLHLKDRIENAQKLNGYVPDFQYYIVGCRDYTQEELQQRNDEMSLVILINRIQSAEDYSEFFHTFREYATSVYEKAPVDIRHVYSDILWSLMMKMNIPVEEARKTIKKLEVSGMGNLFENAEKMDIQAERQNTKRERERADAEKQRADAAEQQISTEKQRADAAEQQVSTEKKRADAAEQRFNQMLRNYILHEKASGKTKEEVLESLQMIYAMTEEEAGKQIETVWS